MYFGSKQIYSKLNTKRLPDYRAIVDSIEKLMKKRNTKKLKTVKFRLARNTIRDLSPIKGRQSDLVKPNVTRIKRALNSTVSSSQLKFPIFAERLLEGRCVTKNYEVTLEIGSTANKKITYFNHSEEDCTYALVSSSDRMVVQSDSVTVKAGGKAPFRLCFVPVNHPGEVTYFLLVDLQEKVYETFQITVTYRF